MKYSLLRVGTNMTKMAEEFKKHIKNYHEEDLKNATDIFKIVSTKLISDSKDIDSRLMTTKLEAVRIEEEVKAARKAP